jgi:hypothetical protein
MKSATKIANRAEAGDDAPLDGRRTRKELVPGMRERFVAEYVRIAMTTGKVNGKQAAINAGYSPKAAHAMACDLLKEEKIKLAIIKLSREAVEEMPVDGPMILRELASIGFSPIIPGYVKASDKTKALDLLGTHHKLWEGARGDRVININILQLDEKTL